MRRRQWTTDKEAFEAHQVRDKKRLPRDIRLSTAIGRGDVWGAESRGSILLPHYHGRTLIWIIIAPPCSTSRPAYQGRWT
jgi:hypothetical protein